MCNLCCRHWKAIYGVLGISIADDRLPKFRELQKCVLQCSEFNPVPDVVLQIQGRDTFCCHHGS
jgi:hypothetical protein